MGEHFSRVPHGTSIINYAINGVLSVTLLGNHRLGVSLCPRAGPKKSLKSEFRIGLSQPWGWEHGSGLGSRV